VKSSPRHSARLRPLNPTEHRLVTPSYKRLTAALAFVLPLAALLTTPVMAATQAKTTKSHHTAVHKVSTHKTSHAKKKTPAAS
jgi:hypothetical protein